MKRGHAIAAAGIVATLVMILGVRGALLYDAAVILRQDVRLQLPIAWLQFFTESYWLSDLWRPLTLTLFGIQIAIPGEVIPSVFLLVSVCLYAAVSALVVLMSTRLGARIESAAIAGILFAVHPVHVETVLSVVGQAEMLAAMALIGGAVVWHRAATQGPDAMTLPLLLLAQAAAIGSKEQGFVMPALLFGQYLLLPGTMKRRRAIELLGSVTVLAVLLIVVRANVIGSISGVTPARHLVLLSPFGRLLTAIGVLPEVLRLMVFPLHLQGEYGPPGLPIGGPILPRHLLGLAILVAWIAGVVGFRRRQPLAAFGFWWAGITWLPSASVIAPGVVVMAERLLFLPSLGFAVAMAALVSGPALARRPVRIIITTACLLLAGRTVLRIPVWDNSETYFDQLVIDGPRVYRAWYIHGLRARNLGRVEEAESNWRHALTLWDREPKVYEELGHLLRASGRCGEAIPVLREGLALDPEGTAMRAKMGECILTLGDSAGARQVALDGLALGQEAFNLLLVRAGGSAIPSVGDTADAFGGDRPGNR